MSHLRPSPPGSRVYLVEDHPCVCEYLSHVCRPLGLIVCGSAPDARQALADIRSLKPALVIVDLTLRNSHGLDLIRDIRTLHHPPRILVFSAHDESVYAERAIRAGAMGYVCKTVSQQEIVQAIERALHGQWHLSPEVTARMVLHTVVHSPRPGDPQVHCLTDRELQVFEALGNALSTREIAHLLGIGCKTVETYRTRIREKLGLETLPQLMRAAVQFTHPNPPGNPDA